MSKSFYEMIRILEAGATTVPPTPLSSSSNPPPSAQANPTGAQLTQQGSSQQKQAAAQQKQDATNKINFIKQLKDLLKRNLGITL